MALTKISNEVIEQNLENYLKKGLKAGSALGDLEISTYADAAGVNPIDGLDGSAGITVSLNTESPLSGDADLRLVKDASNRQGNGVSIPFTIENRHLAKVLQISFDAELFSGAYVSGDLRISIIQDPTGSPVVLEPVNTGIQLGIANQRIRHIASFQTHVSITSYRLCIHVSSTSASAYTVDFANFKVWEPTQSIGAVITEPTLYTPTLTNIPLSSSSLYFHREGAYGFIQGTITLSGVGSAGEARVGLPSGWVISSIISSIREVGRSVSNSTGFGSPGWQGVILAEGGTNYLTFGRDIATTSGLAKLQGNDSSFASLIYTINAKVPIAGWGSSVAMSSDTGDGRVVACSYTNNTSNINPILFSVRDYDTHNAFNPTTGIFTAPVSGYYRATASNIAAISVNGYLTINGENIIYSVSGNPVSGSRTLYRNAGQTISFEFSGGTLYSNGRMSIERISAGSQTIASVETVACSVNKTSGSATTPNRIASWNTKDVDTHNSFDLTTGIFTIPSSGIYLINASAVSLGNFTTYNQPGFTIRNGSTILSASTMYFTSSFEPELSTSALRRFVAGDIISLFGYGNGFACNNLIMNISRIGI